MDLASGMGWGSQFESKTYISMARGLGHLLPAALVLLTLSAVSEAVTLPILRGYNDNNNHSHNHN